MNAKIINPKDYEKRAYNLFYDRVEKEDYIGALGIMHARLRKDPNDKTVLKNLADVYSKMEEYARALFFRFKLLTLSSKENRLFVFKDIILDFDALDNIVLVNYYLSKIYDEYGKEGVYAVANELGEKLNTKNTLPPFYLAYPPNEKYYKRVLEYGKQAINALSPSVAKTFFDQVPLEHFDEYSAKDYITVFMLEEDYEGAIKKLKELLAHYGERTFIYAYISMAYSHLKNKEKADYYLDKTFSVYSDTEDDALDLYELIKDLKPNEKFLPVYEKLSSVYKYNAEYHSDFSDLLVYLGDEERASEEIQVARKIEPDNSTFYLKEKQLIEKHNPEKNSEKKPEKTPFNEKVRYYESFMRVKDSVMAKSAVYSLAEKNSPLSARALDDALLDLEVDNDVKHTIVYAKISFGYLDTISLSIDGKFYEIKPKKLTSGAQNSTFYTAVYALAISKTFESNFCTETTLKNAVNKVYKAFGDRFKGDEDLKDITATVCILAIKELKSSVLIESFGADEKKVNKYLELIKGNQNNG